MYVCMYTIIIFCLGTQVIYNASEGSAVTLPAAPKVVRTFFFANKSTCNNWLTRIRLVMGMVGVKTGQPASTVRNMYALLSELVAVRNTQVSFIYFTTKSQITAVNMQYL